MRRSKNRSQRIVGAALVAEATLRAYTSVGTTNPERHVAVTSSGALGSSAIEYSRVGGSAKGSSAIEYARAHETLHRSIPRPGPQ